MADGASSTAKYFARYAEPEARFATAVDGTYAAAIVVPLCREASSFLAGYEASFRAAAQRCLLIAVVNGAEGASAETHAQNALLLAELERRFSARTELHVEGVVAGAWIARDEHFDLLCLDRARENRRLPRGEGVGLARKIGADLAAALVTCGRVQCNYVGCSDADATLPEDYWACIMDSGAKSSALLWPFSHTASGDEAVDSATVLYEISLRYYVLGLAFAGSPYAYQSVGSSLAFDARAYASVRGFPKREAAEDFYLLDKLAKVAPLARLGGAPIRLQARASDRVPFGTGRGTAEIMAQSARGAPFELYSPRLFAALGAVISGFDAFATSADLGSLRQAVLELAPEDARATLAVLEQTKAFAALTDAARQAPRGAVLRRRVHTWFDALRTLRFLHVLRDAHAPSLPWREALADASFTRAAAPHDDAPEAILARLVELEAQLPLLVGPTAR